MLDNDPERLNLDAVNERQPYCCRIPVHSDEPSFDPATTAETLPIMTFARSLPAIAMAILLATGVAVAQNDSPDKAKQAPDPKAEAKKDSLRRDDLTEVSKQLAGPAGNPECVWLGRRVVSLLWRDDLDTAFRHLDLYDRFGCPGGHVQATFRCVVQQGSIDPKAPESLAARVHSCWVNPAAPPAPAAAAAPATPAPGTTTQ